MGLGLRDKMVKTWSYFQFPSVGHMISTFLLTWISFFSCRSWASLFRHDLDVIILL